METRLGQEVLGEDQVYGGKMENLMKQTNKKNEYEKQKHKKDSSKWKKIGKWL